MNLYIIRTLYSHWGPHSGFNQFLKYIDRDRFNLQIHSASDGDDDFPIQSRLLRSWLRKFVQRRGMKWYKLSDLSAEIKALIKCVLIEIDIVHFLDGEHSVQFLPRVLKNMNYKKPRIVATFHQPPEILETLVIKEVISKLDLITVVSSEQKSFFKSFIDEDKIRLIMHGIDIDYFRPKKNKSYDGKFKCLTVGHHLRDFSVVNDVAPKLKDHSEIEFIIVSSNTKEIKRSHNIKIYKALDDKALLHLYQQSDVLFLPLLNSTANNALLEGIACGLPVISTDLPSIKAYLPGREAILIKDNKSSDFVQSILRLYKNHTLRQNMSREARKRAEELDWRNITSQFESIYSELTNYQ